MNDAGDGRNIDPGLGALAGEAADQRVPGRRAEVQGAVPFDEWKQVPSRPARDANDPTYYDRPVLKEPVWIWSVPAYFYVGGAGGGASVLGAAVGLLDRTGRHRELVRACHWIGVGAGVTSTGLLVHDLGRPERFLNMLRVFRPTSPMSVGSWVLAAYAPAATVAAFLADSNGPLRLLGRAGELGAGLLGMPLAGYTAVLLSNTAVPVWQEGRRSMPALFSASGVTAAASLLDLLALDGHDDGVVRRYGLAGRVAELAAAEILQQEVGRVEQVGKALDEGMAGALWKASKVLTGASLALTLLPTRLRTRSRRAAAGVLGTAGAVVLRFAVFHAGKASARDPRATFHLQRS